MEMVYRMLRSLKEWMMSLLWTLETSSTVELGTCTGKDNDAKKPPLAPRKRGKPRRPVVVKNYWDARQKIRF